MYYRKNIQGMIQDILVEKTAIKSNGMCVDGRNYIVHFTGSEYLEYILRRILYCKEIS